jgi:uncharacterized protein YkwD
MRATLYGALCGLLWLGGCVGGAIDGEGGEGGEAGEGGDQSGGDTGVPSHGDCSMTADWESSWAALEEDVLTIVNMRRSEGASCGGERFDPAPALVMQANLRCAARLHSMDMVERNYFSHDSLDGRSPWDRMEEAGYVGWRAVAENIAAGSPDAAGTMDQWMNSPGHCANIMSPDLTEIGVGYFPGGDSGHMWTQKFGRR